MIFAGISEDLEMRKLSLTIQLSSKCNHIYPYEKEAARNLK